MAQVGEFGSDRGGWYRLEDWASDNGVSERPLEDGNVNAPTSDAEWAAAFRRLESGEAPEKSRSFFYKPMPPTSNDRTDWQVFADRLETMGDGRGQGVNLALQATVGEPDAVWMTVCLDAVRCEIVYCGRSWCWCSVLDPIPLEMSISQARRRLTLWSEEDWWWRVEDFSGDRWDLSMIFEASGKLFSMVSTGRLRQMGGLLGLISPDEARRLQTEPEVPEQSGV